MKEQDWTCCHEIAVLEASFPINLEYPSHSALSLLRIFSAKYPLILKFRNFLHFVSCQRVCATLWTLEMCSANVIKHCELQSNPFKCTKGSSSSNSGSRNVETIWRNDSDICGSFEKQKKRRKTDIFPGNFAVLVAASLTK